MDIPYKFIAIDGQAALVEYQGKRRTIPASGLDEFSEEIFEAGVPYGIPWGSLINVCVTGEHIEKALYDRGIYTASELLANPKTVKGAVNSILGNVFGALIDVAKRHKEV